LLWLSSTHFKLRTSGFKENKTLSFSDYSLLSLLTFFSMGSQFHIMWLWHLVVTLRVSDLFVKQTSVKLYFDICFIFTHSDNFVHEFSGDAWLSFWFSQGHSGRLRNLDVSLYFFLSMTSCFDLELSYWGDCHSAIQPTIHHIVYWGEKK